ncbi:MAG: hypothetical protein GEU79_06980 [Acidimicrobiia bacterium]|nr:hypothetical protein [Acidimicrobiia bacterium]
MLWIVIVLLVATVVALVRGGRLANLADIRLRLWWLLPLGFLLQLATAFVPTENRWRGVGIGLVLLSFVPLLVLVILNRERSGMWLAGIGVLLNFSVIALNGGMPVLTEAANVAAGGIASSSFEESFKHVRLDETTRLSFLGDVIPMRLLGQGQVVSLGDVFLAVGLGRFLESELRRPVRWFKRGVSSKAGSATRFRRT